MKDNKELFRPKIEMIRDDCDIQLKFNLDDTIIRFGYDMDVLRPFVKPVDIGKTSFGHETISQDVFNWQYALDLVLSVLDANLREITKRLDFLDYEHNEI